MSTATNWFAPTPLTNSSTAASRSASRNSEYRAARGPFSTDIRQKRHQKATSGQDGVIAMDVLPRQNVTNDRSGFSIFDQVKNAQR